MDLGASLENLKHLTSPTAYIEKYCKIVTKNATFETVKLNKAQRAIMEYVEECLAYRKPIRIRVLKSRQHGITTLAVCLGFWWATMHENSSYAVVAHKEDSTNSIFEKNKVLYNALPEVLKPRTNKFNSERISYDDTSGEVEGLKSRIFFGTAGGKELFRGETILFLHKSEKAFWENHRELNKSLNATVPYKPFTCIIDESTANGYNFYKDEWDSCVRGESDYKPFFFGWDWSEDNKMKVEPNFTLLPIEEAYMKAHDLTLEQMRWRRWKLVNDYGYSLADIENDDIDDFKQEEPLTPDEAFISSGRGVFNAKVISNGLEYSSQQQPIRYELRSYICKEPLEIYEQPEVQRIIEYAKRTEWDYATQSYIQKDTDEPIGTTIRKGNYVVAVDTSGSGQDKNVITVWHTYKKRKVAQWVKTQISEEDLAKVCIEVAKMYHDAVIAPEVNFSHSLCGFIEKEYTNIYLTESVGTIKQGTMNTYGWKTTAQSKPMLISTMKKALNEDYTICPDRGFWEEAEYFIQGKSPSGKDTYGASAGKHDDIVMSSMIGRYICDSMMVRQSYTTASEDMPRSTFKRRRLFKNYA